MNKMRHSPITIIMGFFLMTLAGCSVQTGFLHAAGPVAEMQRTHFSIVLVVLLAVLVPIYLGIPFILWRYRYRRGRNNAAFRPDWESSRRWEVFLWGGPIVILAVLTPILWIHTHKLDPYRTLGVDPLQVQVVGYDWKWLFIYPQQGVASVNRLIIPKDRPVAVELTSTTVMQSLLIPELAGQIYAMKGMTTQLNLRAGETGEWQGRNTQYNGPGFAAQHFRVEAMEEQEFEVWADEARQAPAFDDHAQSALQHDGTLGDLAKALSRDPSALVFSQVPDTFFSTLTHDGHHQ